MNALSEVYCDHREALEIAQPKVGQSLDALEKLIRAISLRFDESSEGAFEFYIDNTCREVKRIAETADWLGQTFYERRETDLELLLVPVQKLPGHCRKLIDALQRKGKKAVAANLPIEVVFDAPPEEFQRIASLCKYAFKVDQKSMADNASSILSLMANGCIVFTESRYDTPDEFCDNNRALSPVILPLNRYGSCDGAFVVKEILLREGDLAQAANLQTLKNMKTLLKKRYGIDSVAEKHLQLYLTLFEC